MTLGADAVLAQFEDECTFSKNGILQLGAPGSETITIEHRLGEIQISHRFADGFDSIVIAWPVL